MILVLLGPSGCGKGTQAKLLSEKYHLPTYSTGEIIRQEGAAGTPEGREALEYANKGAWAPDELVFRMLKKYLESEEARGGFILDGYPRTIAQAKILEDYLVSRGQKVDKVFSLETSDEVAITRIETRKAHDLKSKGETRADETPEVVIKRLASFRQSSAPVLDFYRKLGVVAVIDNSPPIEEVFQSLLGQLQK